MFVDDFLLLCWFGKICQGFYFALGTQLLFLSQFGVAHCLLRILDLANLILLLRETILMESSIANAHGPQRPTGEFDQRRYTNWSLRHLCGLCNLQAAKVENKLTKFACRKSTKMRLRQTLN